MRFGRFSERVFRYLISVNGAVFGVIVVVVVKFIETLSGYEMIESIGISVVYVYTLWLYAELTVCN